MQRKDWSVKALVHIQDFIAALTQTKKKAGLQNTMGCKKIQHPKFQCLLQDRNVERKKKGKRKKT